MKKKSISLIIGLMSVGLLGVTAMQYYFIRESSRLKLQLFDQAVNEALNAVVYKVEKRDADNFYKRKALEKSQKENDNPEAIKDRIERFTDRLKSRQFKIEQDFKMRDSLIRSNIPRSMTVDNDFYETYLKDAKNGALNVHLQGEIEQMVDANGQIVNSETYQLFADDADKRPLKKSSSDSIRYLNIDNGQIISMPRVDPKLKAGLQEDMAQVQKERRTLDSINNVRQKSSLFEDLAKDYEQANIPFKNRIDPILINNLLKSELANRNINLAYNYKIAMSNSGSTIFTSVADKNVEFLNDNTYTTALFPREMLRESGILTLTFPERNTLMLQNMSVILFSSAGLLIVLIGCFAYTIFIIIRQKKMSEMKTDFINNMTHEFKTPVATIMIASEALKDPEVIEDEQRIKRLANIIYDENVRLGNHIERVLNIAKIDKEDLKLEHNDIDMNDLIAAVVDSMELQLQKKNTKVFLNFKAEHSIIKGDELHLSNVLFNLIDNAIKYSKDQPEISISTSNADNNLIISVKDNGIGMSRDQLSKIFDQFYRIPTGNLHDVKGFGLGLSYVSNIVKSLNGEVRVKSEKSKGSEFEIIFKNV